MSVLEVVGLRTLLRVESAEAPVVDDVSFSISPGRTLGLVGESGCGKSMVAQSVMQLLPPPARIVAGEVMLEGRDLLGLRPAQMRDVRGRRMGMIFQNPMEALNPTLTVGYQIRESIFAHGRGVGRELRSRTLQMLREVEIEDAEGVAAKYPHELSGGMRQRVAIAMALANRPAALIADEPTTALDATVQAAILRLITRLQREMGLAVLLISHDLGVVNEAADDVAVMYLGQIVESGPVDDVLASPAHPYTQALFASRASGLSRTRRLATIEGVAPDAGSWPSGCRFHPRCACAQEICRTIAPGEVGEGSRWALCHFAKLGAGNAK